MSRILSACLVVVLLAGIALAKVRKVQTPQGVKTIGCRPYFEDCNKSPDDRCCNEGRCTYGKCTPYYLHHVLRTRCSALNQWCDPLSGGCCSMNEECDCSTDESTFCVCKPKPKECVSSGYSCLNDKGSCCENLICGCNNDRYSPTCKCNKDPTKCIQLNLTCGGRNEFCCHGTECKCDDDSDNCHCKLPCINRNGDCKTRPNDCCSGLRCTAQSATTMECKVPPPPTTTQPPPPTTKGPRPPPRTTKPRCLTEGELCGDRPNDCCQRKFDWHKGLISYKLQCSLRFGRTSRTCAILNRY